MPPDAHDDDHRQLDEFISLLAHDLRTPLTSIRGYAQLMLRQRRGATEGGRDDDTVSDGLRIIMEQADRLASMTELLLDVSRIRRQRVGLNTRNPVDLSATLRTAAAALSGVQVAIHAPEHGPQLTADGARVQQIIVAMLRFLAVRGGSEPVSATVQVSDGAVTLAADGAGDPLDSEAAKRLLHQLVEPAPSASGWQLARTDLFVARGMAEAHGGSLTVESPPDGAGRGVRLTLTLPLVPPAPD
ncbi:MAG TPA: HAMP domain-containing sensor histidine kinase [Chloroflexota bacterium]|nr:HAMP domain-containing sensor histidine kinase [Chloroflexota bacterium]